MDKITTVLSSILVLGLCGSAIAADPGPGKIGHVNEAGHVLVGIGPEFDPNDPRVKDLIKQHKSRINKERKQKTEKLENAKKYEDG